MCVRRSVCHSFCVDLSVDVDLFVLVDLSVQGMMCVLSVSVCCRFELLICVWCQTLWCGSVIPDVDVFRLFLQGCRYIAGADFTKKRHFHSAGVGDENSLAYYYSHVQ